jgi:hypothetical protein
MTVPPRPSILSVTVRKSIVSDRHAAEFAAEGVPRQGHSPHGTATGAEAFATSSTCTRPTANWQAKCADAGMEVSVQGPLEVGGVVPQTVPISLAARRYSSGPLNSAARSPEDKQRGRKISRCSQLGYAAGS